MSVESFARQVDAFFAERPCEDAQTAKAALLKLYEYVATNANVAAGLGYRTGPFNALLYKMQQAMTWSPLRLFWQVLASDESELIRACAKGNIAEDTGEFFHDPEVGIIAEANLRIMFAANTAMKLQAEVAGSEAFREAQKMWIQATNGLAFMPVLKVYTFDPPPADDR